MNRPYTVNASSTALLLAILLFVGTAHTVAVAVEQDGIQRDMVLVLDNSGSMKINDPDFEASQAVMRFIEKFSPTTSVSIIVFDQSVKLGQDFLAVNDDNLTTFENTLNRIDYQGRYTDSPAAIERAIYELKNYAREDSEKSIVFLTDGIVDTGNIQVDVEKTRWLKQELAADAVDHKINIYSVGFTENADFQLIQSLAQQTGAEYFRALKVPQLDKAFNNIHKRISSSNPLVSQVETDSETESEVSVTNDRPVEQTTDIVETVAPDVSVETTLPNSDIATPDQVQAPADPPAIVAEDIKPITKQVPDESITVLPYALLAMFFFLVVFLVYMFYLRPKWNKKGDEFYISEAYLVDVHGYTKEKRYRLGDSPTMIGRVETQDSNNLKFISINETTIGRRHALVEYREFAFWITDQGSTNGTYVNDRLIDEPTRLKDGDRVRVHKFEFVFEVPELQEDGVTELSSTVLKQTVQAKASELPEPQFDISMGHEIPDTAKKSITSELNIIEYSEEYRPDSEDETILPEQLDQSSHSSAGDNDTPDNTNNSNPPEEKT